MASSNAGPITGRERIRVLQGGWDVWVDRQTFATLLSTTALYSPRPYSAPTGITGTETFSAWQDGSRITLDATDLTTFLAGSGVAPSHPDPQTATPITGTERILGHQGGVRIAWDISEVAAIRAAAGSGAATAPGAVSAFSVSPGNGQNSISWTDGATGGSAITGHKLYRSTVPGGETLLGTIGTGSPYLDTGLTNGTTYYYKISALNAIGEGPLSSEKSGLPVSPSTVPDAPTLSATSGTSQVSLAWVDGSTGGAAITGHKIYRSTTAGFTPGAGNLLASISSSSPYTDSGLTNGTTYYYAISAVNSVGESAKSTIQSATPSGTVATAAAPMTQLAQPGRIYQRDTTTGGGQSKGQGVIPVALGSSTTTGTIYARVSSGGATRGDLQAAFPVTISTAGAQTINIPTIDAALRSFYLDIQDTSGWQNGTTQVMMGDLTSDWGQSLEVWVYDRGSSDPTLASLGYTVSNMPNMNFTRVFATFSGGSGIIGTYMPAVSALTWEIPDDSGHYKCAGVASYLLSMVQRLGVPQGMIGHAVAGSAQSDWQGPSGVHFLQFSAVTAAAGGKWRINVGCQGHADSQSGMTRQQYRTDTVYRIGQFNSVNSFAGQKLYSTTAIPNIHYVQYPYLYGYAQQMNNIRAGAVAGMGDVGGVYVDMPNTVLRDGIHWTVAGTIEAGKARVRALTSDNVGPSVASATRSGTTITVTMNNLGTNLQVVGSWWQRFTAYASGSMVTTWPISNGTYSGTGNTMTLTLANDPGVGTALDLWLGAPNDGDVDKDPSGLMIWDDRTDDLDAVNGRPFKASKAATVIAAPTPGGATNTAPARADGRVSPLSMYDTKMGTGTAFSAEVKSGFGPVMSAGYLYTDTVTDWGTSSAMPSQFYPMSEEFFFVAPTTINTGTTIFTQRKGNISTTSTRKLSVRWPIQSGSTAGAAATNPNLVALNLYWVCVVYDNAGVRLYLQNLTANETVATKYLDNSATTMARYGVDNAAWGIAATSAGANGFLSGSQTSNDGKMFHYAVWNTSRDSGGAPSAPATPYTGNESGLVMLYRMNSDGLDSVRACK